MTFAVRHDRFGSMHRAVTGLALLALTACAMPSGTERAGCSAEWLDAPDVIARGGGIEERSLTIDCVEPIGPRRVRLGFTLPPGPSCHLLQRVELVESADAVSIALVGAVSDDPNAGACSEEARRVVTEVDLQAPIGDRSLLDGSE